MSFDFLQFERNIIDSLKKEGLIKKFYKAEFKKTPSLNLIIESFVTAYNISFDSQGLFIIKDKEKLYCPAIFSSIDEKGLWLSDSLPEIEFDIEQSGNVRKADEAESMYCCINIANILKESTFVDELKEVSENYDFNSMTPNVNYKSFRDLLIFWQNFQSVIIGIIVSACKFKISDSKKNIEKYLKDGLSELEVAGLRDVETKIRQINYRFSEGELSPRKVKELTKIEKLKLIDERDSEISNVIKSSKFGVLYRILNLSTEYISPVQKMKVQIWLRNAVDKKINATSDNKELVSERSQLLSRLQKKVLSEEKISVRKIEMGKYIKDRSSYVLPSKL